MPENLTWLHCSNNPFNATFMDIAYRPDRIQAIRAFYKECAVREDLLGLFMTLVRKEIIPVDVLNHTASFLSGNGGRIEDMLKKNNVPV